MPERKRVTGRSSTARQLLLVAVLVTAVSTTAGARPAGTDATPGPLSAPAGETPPVASHTPPRFTSSPLPEPPVDRPAARSPRTTAAPGAEPARPSGPATMAASVPVRLQVPSIGVDTGLADLGLLTDGTLGLPPSGFPAGWYTGSPTPGELGPAIIAGHVDWGGQPGVFFDLRDLSPGDEIAITREDGSTARFQVTRVERFAKVDFPTAAVYGDLDHAGLRLITCGGPFDPQVRSYEENVVVFAELDDAVHAVADAPGSTLPWQPPRH